MCWFEQKNYFGKNSIMISQKFGADLESAEKNAKMFTKKSYRPKTFVRSTQTKKTFSHHFFGDNFFRMNFLQLFNGF
jgi:hypothetical protein